MFGLYDSGQIIAHLSVAQQSNLLVYFEYLRKRDGGLRTIEGYPKTINADHVILLDNQSKSIKRLNYDRIYRIGLQKVEA